LLVLGLFSARRPGPAAEDYRQPEIGQGSLEFFVEVALAVQVTFETPPAGEELCSLLDCEPSGSDGHRETSGPEHSDQAVAEEPFLGPSQIRIDYARKIVPTCVPAGRFADLPTGRQVWTPPMRAF